VALLIIVIVASTIMRRRWTGEPRPFRRRFGIGAALLSCFLAVAPPFLITLVLAGEHGQTAEIMSTAALFWIPAFAVAIPAVIQAVRLARRNRV